MTLPDLGDAERSAGRPPRRPSADRRLPGHHAGLSGRKFAADSRDIAEQLGRRVSRGDGAARRGRAVRGYAAVHRRTVEPEIADFVIDPEAPSNIIDDVVRTAVARFEREAATSRARIFG